MTSNAKYWQEKLDELNRTELDTVQATAGKWQATISTLLGVFGAVAFVSGANAIEKLPADEARQAKYTVLVAVVLALLAILASTYAAQGIPRAVRDMDWPRLEEHSHTRAARALVALRTSQGLAILAALLVLAGSLIVLFNTDPKGTADAVNVLVRTPTTAVCGGLVDAQNGLALQPSSGASIPLDSTMEVLIVPTCPEPAESAK